MSAGLIVAEGRLKRINRSSGAPPGRLTSSRGVSTQRKLVERVQRHRFFFLDCDCQNRYRLRQRPFHIGAGIALNLLLSAPFSFSLSLLHVTES